MHKELENYTDEGLFEIMCDSNLSSTEVNSMTKEELLSDDTFYKIFDINDLIERERKVAQLEKRAEEFGCKLEFKRIYNAYKKQLKESYKPLKKEEHYEIAESLMNENSFAIYNGSLYMYIDGVYQSDRWKIEKRIVERIQEADSHFRSEVYKDLELRNEEIKLEKETGIINFKNGLLSIENRELNEHTPDFFSINQIPVCYNPNAKVVLEVDDFFNKISSGNEKRKKAILQMIGYFMTTSVKLQKAFILYGETARNGKSTLCNVITELLGQSNISNISLKDISKNVFATSSVRGKLLNIGAEMTEELVKDTSIFKMLTTGDSMAVEEKFKAKQTISPYAKFLFNANTLPMVSDTTNGFYRRIHIIPLETSFTEKDSKEFDINKILTKDALEYIARIVVEAYASMNGVFANYEESDKEVEKYKSNANSVLVFIQDAECNPLYNSKKEYVIAKEMYTDYEEYCKANLYQILGRNTFYKEVEKFDCILVSKKENQKIYKWCTRGIKNSLA